MGMKAVFVRNEGAEYTSRPDSVAGLTAWLFLVQDKRRMTIEKADSNWPKCRFGTLEINIVHKRNQAARWMIVKPDNCKMILAAIIPALMLSSLVVIVTPTAAAVPASVFFDNFDGVDKGWTHSGFWNKVENPQNLAISAQINPRLVHLPDNGHLPSAYSDGKCYWYGEASTGTFIGSDFDPLQGDESGGRSTASNDGWLVSPTVDLSGLTSAYLSFETWWEIEGVDVDRYDMMKVFVNVSGGSSHYLGAINPLNDVNGNSWKPYSSAGLGSPGVWENIKVELSDYAGDVVNIAFFFETRDNLYNGFRGWLIDDVNVFNGALPPVTLSAASPGAGGVGKKVTVQGLNFCLGAEVEIGGIQASDVSVLNSEKLEFLVPSGLAVGNYAINVTNPGGSKVTLPNAFQVTNVQSPVISSVVPVKAGTDISFIVNVTGYYFLTGCTVKVASATCEILEATSTYVIAKAPSGLPLGYQNLKLTNPDTQYDLKQGAILVQPQGYTPSGLTATSSSGKIDLQWTAPTNLGTIVSYEVYKGTSLKNMKYLKDVTGTSCSDTDVKDGTTYYYSVLAVNSSSTKSGMSGIASVTLGGGVGGLDLFVIVGVVAAIAVVAVVVLLVIRSRAHQPKLGTTPGGGSGQSPPAVSSCPQCGTPLAPGTTFCGNCGRKLG